MSVIVRLQNLPLSAQSRDIRNFFGKLHIPKGGVHILGGERGDAFIVFERDEDARIAMKLDGDKIKGCRIKLSLSSHNEMKYEIQKITKYISHTRKSSKKHAYSERLEYSNYERLHHENEDLFSMEDLARSKEHYNVYSSRMSLRETSLHVELSAPSSEYDRFLEMEKSNKMGMHLSHTMSQSWRKSQSRSPPLRSMQSPPSRSRSSWRKSNSPPMRSRSTWKGSFSHHPRQGSPWRRSRSPNARPSSPWRRSRSPSARSASPWRRSPSPSARSGSPWSRNSRHKRPHSPWRSSRSPCEKSNSPWRRSYSPFTKPGSPWRRSRSPLARTESRWRHSPSPHKSYDRSERSRSPYAKHGKSYKVSEPFSPEHSNVRNLSPDRIPSPFGFEESYSSNRSIFATSALSNSVSEDNYKERFSSTQKNDKCTFDAVPDEASRGSPVRFQRHPFDTSFKKDSEMFLKNMVTDAGYNLLLKPNDFSSSTMNFNDNLLLGEPPEVYPNTDSGRFFGFPGPFPNNPAATVSGGNPPGFFPPSNPVPYMTNDTHLACSQDFRPHEFNNFPENRNFMQFPFYPTEINSANVFPQMMCVAVSGLDHKCNCWELQMMFKDLYIPDSNIRWKLDEHGFKTDTAFLKLMNPGDFDAILKQPSFVFKNMLVSVTVCPDFVAQMYFSNAHPYEIKMPQQDLCYMLKGLPFTTVQADIARFFEGLRTEEIYIIYNNKGKATGTGYVTFASVEDYQEAVRKNGMKIGHRYIELFPSKITDMIKAKKRNHDFNFDTKSSRSLCAVLTGLPSNISTGKIAAFFFAKINFRPDAIHMTLNEHNQPNGRAFVEFSKIVDLDAALKCHGSYIDNSLICVKQVLYDEMVKILSTQRAKHDFISATNKNTNDLPEKVPYLWDPDEATKTEPTIQESIPSFSYDTHKQDFKFVSNSKHLPKSGSNSSNLIKCKVLDTIKTPASSNVSKGNFKSSFQEVSKNDSKKSDDPNKAPVKSQEAVKTEEAISDKSCTDKKSVNQSKNSGAKPFSWAKKTGNASFSKKKIFIKPYFQKRVAAKPVFNKNSKLFMKNKNSKQQVFKDKLDVSGEIHLSNVHPSVDTQALVEFFCGFSIDREKCIRRFTESGEPTGDVRITFSNRQDAEKAVQALNGCSLKGVPVEMFVLK